MAEMETIRVPIEPELSEGFAELLQSTSSLGDLVESAAKAAREHNVTVMLTISPNDG